MSASSMIMILAAGVILARAVCLAGKLNARDWPGHPVRFIGIAAGNALLAAGAVGTVLGWHAGTLMLMVGAAAKLLADRRAPQ